MQQFDYNNNGIAEVYDCARELLPAALIGADYSGDMLAQARAKLQSCDALLRPQILLLQASGEALPLRQCLSFVFLLNVYHHLADKARFVSEIGRVTLPGARVVLRTATVETAQADAVMQAFPEALALEKKRGSSALEICREFTQAGFVEVRSEVLAQPAGTWSDYFPRIRHRAVSVLRLIADEIFQKRLAEFSQWCAGRPHDEQVLEPLGFFVFVKQ